MYHKVGKWIMLSICFCSRHRVSERGKLYCTTNMCMSYMLCIRKKETAAYLWPIFCVSERGNMYYAYNMCMSLHYIYVLGLVCQKGNCIIPTVCLWTILCIICYIPKQKREKEMFSHLNCRSGKNWILFYLNCIGNVPEISQYRKGEGRGYLGHD